MKELKLIKKAVPGSIRQEDIDITNQVVILRTRSYIRWFLTFGQDEYSRCKFRWIDLATSEVLDHKQYNTQDEAIDAVEIKGEIKVYSFE